MVLLNYWRYLECIQNNVQINGLTDTSGFDGWYMSTPTDDANYKLNTNMWAQFASSSEDILPPAISSSDYTVASQHTSDLQFTGITSSITVDDQQRLKRIYTVTGRHTNEVGGGSVYKIYRVGIGKKFTGTYGSGSIHDTLLVEMDLDEPLIVRPYNSFIITLTWNEG